MNRPTNSFTRAIGLPSAVAVAGFKARDTVRLDVYFHDGASQVGLAEDFQMVFALKAGVAGAAVVYAHADEWVEISTGHYMAVLSLNTANLVGALGDLGFLTASGELTWNEGSGWESSNTLAVRIENDVWKGTEGTPLEEPDPEDWLAARLTAVTLLPKLQGAAADPEKIGDEYLADALTRELMAGDPNISTLRVGGVGLLDSEGNAITVPVMMPWDEADSQYEGPSALAYKDGANNWTLDFNTLPAFTSSAPAASVIDVASWVPEGDAAGSLVLFLFPALIPSRIGQWCRVETAVEGVYDWYQAVSLDAWKFRFTDGVAFRAVNPPSIIEQDASNRFVTDAEKAGWDAKARFFAVSNYGAGPTKTAAQNVAGFQAASNAANTAGGGIVLIDVSGTYPINDTVVVYNYTTVLGVGGVVLEKSGSNFGEVFRNAGAATRTMNYGIRLKNFKIDVNGNELRSTVVPGLMGHISMFWVEDYGQEDIEFLNHGLDQFATHLCHAAYFYAKRISATGDRDGMHLGGNCHDFVFEDCKYTTLDDGFGCQPADYPGCSPETGNIYNGRLIRCEYRDHPGQVGYFWRSVHGAWTNWTTATLYKIGRRCVNAGNVYVCTNDPGASVSAVAPTHSSGSVTGADGITWRHDHVGTDTTANCWGITLEDCINTSKSEFLVAQMTGVGHNYPITPGEEDNAYMDDIHIRGGSHEPSETAGCILGAGYIKRVTVSGFKFGANTNNIITQIFDEGYTASTDPRTDQTSVLTLRDCVNLGGGIISASRQNVTIDVFAENIAGNPLACASGAAITGMVRVNGDAVVSNRSILEAPQEGDTLKGAIYQYGRWVSSSPLNVHRTSLHFGYETNSGTASASTPLDNAIELYAGTDAGGYALARYAADLASARELGNVGINFNNPFTIIGRWAGITAGATGGRVRFVVGGVSNSVPLATANALADKGIGVEFGYDGTGKAARLLVHDGTTYTAGSWIALGAGPYVTTTYAFALSNLGGGVIKLYVSSGDNSWPALPTTASASVTNGPTGTQTNHSDNRHTGWMAVSRGDTAPGANHVRGLFYPITLDQSNPA